MSRASMRRGRAGLAAVALTVTGLLTAACGPTFTDLPLPGSGVGGDTTTVNFEFEEALNLATGAVVKVNGVDFGKVQEVTTKDFKAQVKATMAEGADIRENATARLRYTTPLGELYVDVRNPDDGSLITDGGTLDPARATVAPTVEDALSQASLLINGGGLAQLQIVTSELNEALNGREQTVRQLMERSLDFTRQANAATGDIVAALDALSSLSKTLKANETTIDRAMREIRPAAAVLREQTPELTVLLQELNRFARSANNIVGQTKQDLLTMINQVTPILDEMLANKPVLSESLRALTRASNNLDGLVPGDYLNLSGRLKLESALSLLGGSVPVPSPARGSGPQPSANTLALDPSTLLSGNVVQGLTQSLTGLLGGN